MIDPHSILNMEPKLDPPGRGLPLIQKIILRMILPLASKRSSWQDDASRYDRNSNKIINLLQGSDHQLKFNLEQFNQRVLVNPIKGLEDSSRYWSLAMTLDHLIITGEAFKKVTIDLSNGVVPPIEVRIENVKPPLRQHSIETFEKFKQMVNQQSSIIEQQTKDRKSTAKLAHPWFGKMTAHQWHWLMGIHQGIHLQQIKMILKELS